jgi:hypothetical protein
MEFLLTLSGIKVMLVYYFRFLMRFHLDWLSIGKRYTTLELVLIGLILVFLFLELQCNCIIKFYRKRPTLLAQHFPEK